MRKDTAAKSLTPINGISKFTKLFFAALFSAPLRGRKTQKKITYLPRALLCTLILPLLVSAGGCGYRFNPMGENISPNIQKIYIDVFANNTPEANIETEFRNAFVDQFIKGRRFKVVKSAELADAVLKSEIRNLATAPLAYRGAHNVAAEKKITVTLALSLTARDSATILWQDNNFTQWEDFALGGGSFNATQLNQQNALSKLARDAAERAYRMMTSDF